MSFSYYGVFSEDLAHLDATSKAKINEAIAVAKNQVNLPAPQILRSRFPAWRFMRSHILIRNLLIEMDRETVEVDAGSGLLSLIQSPNRVKFALRVMFLRITLRQQ
jgi:hypothetical protein